MQIIFYIMVFMLAICTFILWIWLRKINKDNFSSLTIRNIGKIETYLERMNLTIENLNSKFWDYDSYLISLQKAIEEEQREIVTLLKSIRNLIENEKGEGNYPIPKENELLVTELSQKVKELETKLEQHAQNGWVAQKF